MMIVFHFSLLLSPPLLAALLTYLVRDYRRWVGWSNTILSLISLGAALGFVIRVLVDRHIPTWGLQLDGLGLQDIFRVDGLSALLLICVTTISTLTLVLSPGLGKKDDFSDRPLRQYYISMNLLIAALLLATVANNVGVMWVALEATTIFSAFLIPFKLTKASVEASWKYILINSVGIALAFVGTVLTYFDFVAIAGEADNALNWSVLIATAPRLQPEILKLAFVFLLIGYGTKAGIAPMHTWKPDAYGESPTPLGAMMSSALFAVAMYAILRWKAVVDTAIGHHYTDTLLLILGVFSLGVAAFSAVQTRHYKRMLAYSSVEHTGLICLGFALGAPGLFAALLHLLNHTLAKSFMFFVVGRIEDRYGSNAIDRVRGLGKTMPWTSGLFTAGLLALIGLPPFGLFTSEFALFRAGFSLHHPWLMVVSLTLLAIIFVAFINHLNHMLYGLTPAGVAIGETGNWQLVPLFLCIGSLVILGLTLPTPIALLLNQIVTTIAS
ncbi:MAG: hypothetical protein KME17_23675 [Cyanosarcina radialis HA8281-LM2]|jgi:hydrogenase-4 component F|nr:hypothetical protein [Cyanosarcina radialis HA8281-LM2]